MSAPTTAFNYHRSSDTGAEPVLDRLKNSDDITDNKTEDNIDGVSLIEEKTRNEKPCDTTETTANEKNVTDVMNSQIQDELTNNLEMADNQLSENSHDNDNNKHDSLNDNVKPEPTNLNTDNINPSNGSHSLTLNDNSQSIIVDHPIILNKEVNIPDPEQTNNVIPESDVLVDTINKLDIRTNLKDDDTTNTRINNLNTIPDLTDQNIDQSHLINNKNDNPNTSKDFKEVENSLTRYRMKSVLSQSTGQEKQLPDNKYHEQNNNRGNQNGEDSDTSLASTTTGQDSLIFQQSGLTLYNMGGAQPSTKNMYLNKGTTMTRNASQQSLQRQESYLSFRVPENNHNLQMSPLQTKPSQSTNKVEISNNQVPNQYQNDLANRDRSRPTTFEHQQKTDSPQQSLLSKQAQETSRGYSKNKKQEDVLNIDLSSYLSAQEPTIESRTQQKLWLQRENVATLNDSEEINGKSSQIVNQTTRFQYEKLSREFLHIRRYNNPIVESLNRINIFENDNSTTMSIDNKEKRITAKKSVSKIIGNSLVTQKTLTPSSLGQSLRAVPNAEGIFETYNNDLDEYQDLITELWLKNVTNFTAHNQRPTPVPSVTDLQRSAPLSARYGYQPPQQNIQYTNPFLRGNHTSFGQNALSNNTNTTNNSNMVQTSNHISAMNGVHHPTTRAQQQQEHQRRLRSKEQQL